MMNACVQRVRGAVLETGEVTLQVNDESLGGFFEAGTKEGGETQRSTDQMDVSEVITSPFHFPLMSRTLGACADPFR